MTAGSARPAAVALRALRKRYGGTHALHGVDLDLAAGQVHAFVGENGAGKSTCLSVLAGRVAPTAGTARVHGAELHYGDPRACRRSGIVAIHQELTIVPALDAQANVFLGQPLARRGLLDERRMRERYVQLCHELGVAPVPEGVPAGRLSVAEQQLIEIMRALVTEARLILFDEPTAALALHEREALLARIGRLRAAGLTVVFVSHNLDEVLEVSDTVTVFRDGRVAATAPRRAWDKRRLVHAMLGEEGGEGLARALLEESHAPRRARPRGGDAALLRVRGLTVPGSVTGIDLHVRAGEILGLGGLVGSGRTTVLRALAGLERGATGDLWVDGRPARLPRTVREAHALGIALLPEDRKRQGLVMQLDAMSNVALGDLGAAARLGFLSRRRLARAAGDVAADFSFSRARIAERAGNLSGGNQQKLLLARWRFWLPRLLLADEPTRGIDIGAKAEIMSSLEEMAASGMAIVVVSSELEEVSSISDRVAVLAQGRCAGVLDRGDGEITPGRIMSTAFGLEHSHAAA